MLNTGGGIADGDMLAGAFAVAPGAHMVVATQAAERVYRARPGARAARVDLHIAVAEGARFDHLPQETILFDGCALERRLRVDLSATGAYLGVETLVFGRAASGEALRRVRLRDSVELRRNGRLLLHDSVRLSDATALRGPAAAAGAGAACSIVYAASDAPSLLDPLRGVLAATAGPAAASLRDGVLVARILGRDSRYVRQAVVACLAVLRRDRPLPRVWSC